MSETYEIYKATGIITCYRYSLKLEEATNNTKSENSLDITLLISSDLKYEDKNLWINYSDTNDAPLLLPCNQSITANEKFYQILLDVALHQSKATFYIKYNTDKKTAELYAVELTNEK